MRKLIALLALVSCSAFADYSPLPKAQADYVQAHFAGIWNANNAGVVTIDHDGGYFTLLLDEDEARDSKIIDVDTLRGILTVEFTDASGNISVLSLRSDSDGDLWFSVGANRFPLQFVRRITERDRDRIECLTGPVAARNSGQLSCGKMGL